VIVPVEQRPKRRVRNLYKVSRPQKVRLLRVGAAGDVIGDFLLNVPLIEWLRQPRNRLGLRHLPDYHTKANYKRLVLG
jgi:hypothetical protein